MLLFCSSLTTIYNDDISISQFVSDLLLSLCNDDISILQFVCLGPTAVPMQWRPFHIAVCLWPAAVPVQWRHFCYCSLYLTCCCPCKMTTFPPLAVCLGPAAVPGQWRPFHIAVCLGPAASLCNDDLFYISVCLGPSAVPVQLRPFLYFSLSRTFCFSCAMTTFSILQFVSDLLLSLWEEGWEPMTPIDMAAKEIKERKKFVKRH